MKAMGFVKTAIIGMALMAVAPVLHSQPWDGGEITWECTPQGHYRFILKLYRECYAINLPTTQSLTSNAPGFPNISMTRVSMTDLSPQCGCPGGTPVSCATASSYNTGTVQLNVYTSDNAYPDGVPLTGVPPASGWYFGYSMCCRNASTNLASAYSNMFYRAYMYPYNNMPVDACFDNSPTFNELPHPVVCTGYPFAQNFTASDAELDSLSYEWAYPLASATNTITSYNGGFAYHSPFPGTMAHPGNIAADFIPGSGLVMGTSFTPGNFLAVAKVTAYKCGIRVAEVYREVDFAIQNCDTANAPPVIAPVFPNSTGQYPIYTDTLVAGQLASFTVTASDFQYCPATFPPVPQVMSMTAFGSQFGTPLNPGCINPPCAMLNPAPTDTAPLTGSLGIQTTFTWQTCCQHLSTNAGCGTTTNAYHFLVKVRDNFCPVPAFSYAIIRLVVMNLPAVMAPVLQQPVMLPGGDVQLLWNPSQDTMNSFKGYFIWSANTPAGPFTLIDSLMNLNDTNYTHTGAGANLHPVCYYISVISGCFGSQTTISDTVCGTTIGISEDADCHYDFTVGNIIPNPASGITTIPYTLPEEGSITLTITDLTGKTLSTYTHHGKAGNNHIALDVSRFSPGIYFYTVQYKGMRSARRMVVQRF